MQKEINIRLNVNRAKAVHTGQKFASGDKGIVFKLAVDELDTTNTTAKIVFKRSNGTSVEAGITAEDGIYSYTTLGNEFAVVGKVTADVKFYEGEKRISTCTFVFDVVSDTLDGIGTGTGGYSDTLEKMKKEMEEILAQMKEVMDGAEEDVEAAEKKMADLTADLEALYQEYVEAFGSTGPFNPRGPYSETESYTVRDLVTYDDASWVCYRNCTGATPSKESDCWQYFAVGAEVNLDDIIDGTKQVGDAKKLNGHEEEYFAPKTGLERHKVTMHRGASVEELDNIYNSLHTNASITEWYRALVNHAVFYPILGGGAWYVEGYKASDTYGWQIAKNYLVGSGVTGIYMRALVNSNTWGAWIRVATSDDFANYLPLTGGQLDGNTFPILTLNRTTANGSMIGFNMAGTAVGYLGFNAKNSPVYVDALQSANYSLLHTGNKPTGTYTGNGSARDISVGGIGGIIAVRGNDHNMIVTGSGSFGCKLSNGTFVVENSNVSKFINGKLSLAENSVLNAVSLNFPYEVL